MCRYVWGSQSTRAHTRNSFHTDTHVCLYLRESARAHCPKRSVHSHAAKRAPPIFTRNHEKRGKAKKKEDEKKQASKQAKGARQPLETSLDGVRSPLFPSPNQSITHAPNCTKATETPPPSNAPNLTPAPPPLTYRSPSTHAGISSEANRGAEAKSWISVVKTSIPSRKTLSGMNSLCSCSSMGVLLRRVCVGECGWLVGGDGEDGGVGRVWGHPTAAPKRPCGTVHGIESTRSHRPTRPPSDIHARTRAHAPHGGEAEGGDLGGADEARVGGGREDLLYFLGYVCFGCRFCGS